MLPQVVRNHVSCGASEARGNDLDPDHQRRREQHAPQHAEPELGAGLRIGGDAARIVVGGAGDEAGSETIEKAAAEGFHVGGLLRTQVHYKFRVVFVEAGTQWPTLKRHWVPAFAGTTTVFADAVAGSSSPPR